MERTVARSMRELGATPLIATASAVLNTPDPSRAETDTASRVGGIAIKISIRRMMVVS